MKPDDFAILSARAMPEIASIWAVVVKFGDGEAIVRMPPSSKQRWITDDPELARWLLREARKASGYADAYLVRFDRAVTTEGDG